jgi:hypothetical protein
MVLKVVSLKGLCKNNEVLIGFPRVFIVLGLDILLSHILTRANQWRNCHNECLRHHYVETWKFHWRLEDMKIFFEINNTKFIEMFKEKKYEDNLEK